MRKRILCAALAACLALAASVPALAEAEEKTPRLAGVKLYVDGELDVEYTYTYDGGSLPAAGRQTVLGDHTYVMFEGTDRETVRDGMPSLDWTWDYDETGRVTTEHTETYPSGNTYVTRWVYDKDGRLLRLERESPEGSGLAVLSSVESYTYGEDGRLLYVASSEDGVVDFTSEYTYASDGSFSTQNNFFVTELDGKRLDDTGRPFHDKGAVSQTVYDYGGDGQVCRALSIVDGMLWSETAYTYEEDAVFTIQRALEHGYMNEGDTASCAFFLNDAAGKAVLSFSLPGEPVLERDEAGRLVKAETENRYMEFIYE